MIVALLAVLALVAPIAKKVGRGVARAARAAKAVPGATFRTVRRGQRKVQQILLDLWQYWYGSRKRHLPQERFIFGGWITTKLAAGAKVAKRVWAKFQGLLGGRGVGKTHALMKKVVILAQLNQGTPELPIWGAIFGRTLKEVEHKLLPVLMEICTELERDLGVPMKPIHDPGRGVLIFPFGSAVYLLSYEDPSSLELARGYNLGWAVIDELEVARVGIQAILAVLNFAIRDIRAKFKCFAWASTPKGLKGMPKLHFEAFKRGDPQYRLVHGTIYDNPYLSPDDIETIRRTIPSKRLWNQEGLALCVQARNTVFPEYDERRHVRTYKWNRRHKTVIIIDWGLSKAYIGACKVDDKGVWTVALERKVVDTTRARFRLIVQDFIKQVRRKDGGAYPYAIACDRAVSSEKYWLQGLYGPHCGGRVIWLSEQTEMLVSWGCSIISSLLEPDAGEPKLYLASSLSSDIEPATLGMRGGFTKYTYETERDPQTGEEVVSDTPSKKNAADDPIDALRYGIVGTRHMAELHGGEALPFLADPTEVPTQKKAA